MKEFMCLACFFTLTIHAFAQTDYPEAELQNDQLELDVYLPDAQQGYYRGTRFDWSGVINSLRYKGHEYFGPWREHDPLVHDAITGPVEAFTPIGFEEAEAGEPFLVIGVGTLRKPDAEAYQFHKTYDIINSGKWKVKKNADRIVFTQALSTKEGYAYEYTKTLRLVPGAPKFLLEHSLKNTGKLPIETTVYNHNFFTIDEEPTGPNIVTKFPYPISAEGRGFGELITVQGDKLVYTQKLQKGENVYTPGIEGFSEHPEDYHISIENKRTGAGVNITSDQSLLKLVYWASVNTACPEPYITIDAQPGETFGWTITYEFYTFEPATSGRE
ncbi:hypothetical protein OKW21_003951 [Catalinimonas alkaloidigena]|uniref:hypothetical protein n=1 Tax=Catalinimonas alkaloidigena TaxID=1075417 RepID=UPI0024074E40|nr:hypothetical protein [Catalinimonas alkaloidigena]MDF9798688.1 hypothetical protein [Catalinimonas alkaloidigena]